MRKKVLSIFLLVFVAISGLVCAFAAAGEIHEATRKGDLAAVKKLLEQGADINETDKDGNTPLHVAAANGYMEIVRFLTEYEASLSKKSKVEQGTNVQAKPKDNKTVANILSIENDSDIRDLGDVSILGDNPNKVIPGLMTIGFAGWHGKPDGGKFIGRSQPVFNEPFIYTLKELETARIQGYAFSNDLKALIRDARIAMAMLVLMNSCAFEYSNDSLTISFGTEWLQPFEIGQVFFGQIRKTPGSGSDLDLESVGNVGSLYFRSGKIGIRRGEFWVKSSTEAKYRNIIYRYDGNHWNKVETETEGLKGSPIRRLLSSEQDSLLVTEITLKYAPKFYGIAGKKYDPYGEEGQNFPFDEVNYTDLKIDGRISGNNERTNRGIDAWRGWEELSPGHHTYEYTVDVVNKSYDYSTKEFKTREEKIIISKGAIQIEPKSVYLLIGHYIPLKNKEGEEEYIIGVPEGQKPIIKLPHKYDPVTGMATNPTDSKLSFRVK